MRRIAVIAYHSSPLLEPGIGDAGGMTVYVREVAESLAKLGVRTDIFTRSASGEIEITDIFPAVRVVAIPAGPDGEASKRDLIGYHPRIRRSASGRSLRAATWSYELVHSHYWQSGLAGARARTRLGRPPRP